MSSSHCSKILANDYGQKNLEGCFMANKKRVLIKEISEISNKF